MDPKPSDLFGSPLSPPAEWFEPIPEGSGLLSPGLKATVTDEGRVYGYFYQWGVCVIGASAPGECWTAPPSPTAYGEYHQGDVIVTDRDGSKKSIKAGMLVPGHAPPESSVEASIEHYNSPEKGRVMARAYENEHGAYIVGALVPWATHADAYLIRGAALSGHWVYLNDFVDVRGQLDSGWVCIGPSMVVRPGAPLDRHQVASMGVLERDRGDGTRDFVTVPVPVPDLQVPSTVMKSITIAGKTYELRDEAPTVTAAPFDVENPLHVAVVEAIAAAHPDEAVEIGDIGDPNDPTVEFLIDGVPWAGTYEQAEDGTVTVTAEPTAAPDEGIEPEQTASVVDSPDMTVLLARLDAVEEKNQTLESMLASIVSEQITADELGPEPITEPNPAVV